MEYDVFISCKSEDYPLAEQVYKYLYDNGIHSFLSSKELDKLGEAEYADAIEEALECSYNMVVVASSKKNVISKWVKFEWSAFHNEILSGRKPGQIITILDSIGVPDLPMRLREYQSFNSDDYTNILTYLETPSSKSRKKKVLEDEAATLHMEEIKAEIKEKAFECVECSHRLELLSKQIVALNQELGNEYKICPVCNVRTYIDAKYCEKCGWTFNPIYDHTQTTDKKHLDICQSIWKRSQCPSADSHKETLSENNNKRENSVGTDSHKPLPAPAPKPKPFPKTYLSIAVGCIIAFLVFFGTYYFLTNSVDVTLSTAVDNATITLDGKQIDSLSSVTSLSKGSHTISITASGYKPFERTFAVSADSTAFAFEPETINETITVNGVSFKMIGVQGGTFKMGSDSGYSDEKPVHEVTLSSYHIGETEVTQQLWEAVMGSNPSDFKGSQNPVEQVSWNDCQEFIAKLNSLTGKNFRLPTEAEWEFAARGGNKSQWYKYSGSDDIGTVAWYTENISSKTHAVRTKSPNELGIYDMSGNVWEWCNDWKGDYPSTPVTNPTGPSSASSRVIRGGSWDNNASCCRVSLRFRFDPTDRNYNLGLRLAL